MTKAKNPKHKTAEYHEYFDRTGLRDKISSGKKITQQDFIDLWDHLHEKREREHEGIFNYRNSAIERELQSLS